MKTFLSRQETVRFSHVQFSAHTTDILWFVALSLGDQGRGSSKAAVLESGDHRSHMSSAMVSFSRNSMFYPTLC